jgi:hypothetical protein
VRGPGGEAANHRNTEKLDCLNHSGYSGSGLAMISIKMDIEIDESRHLEIDLPDSVIPGKHELIMILGEAKNGSGRSKDLNSFAGSIPWKVDGLEFQKQMRSGW